MYWSISGELLQFDAFSKRRETSFFDKEKDFDLEEDGNEVLYEISTWKQTSVGTHNHWVGVWCPPIVSIRGTSEEHDRIPWCLYVVA